MAIPVIKPVRASGLIHKKAAVQTDAAGRQPRQESFVIRNDHHRLRWTGEDPGQTLFNLRVPRIGRLVECQYIGLHVKNLATGQFVGDAAAQAESISVR